MMVFYGLTLNSVSLFGNLYWNVAAGGLIELPAYGLCHLLSTCSLGRRATQAFFLVLAGVCVVGAHFVPQGEVLFLEYHVVSIVYIPTECKPTHVGAPSGLYPKREYFTLLLPTSWYPKFIVDPTQTPKLRWGG